MGSACMLHPRGSASAGLPRGCPTLLPACSSLAAAPLPPSPPTAPHLLQGDNNWGDDRTLYPKGQLWLNPGHIMGKVVG